MERGRATAAAAPDPAVRDFAPSLAQSPEGQRLLQTIFANSPFLSHCLIADIGLLAAVLNMGPGGVLKNVLGTVKSTAAEAGEQADLMRSLRVCRTEEHQSELQSLMRNSFAVVCVHKHTTVHRQ